MSISIKRYVDIVSGVGGGAAVARRELIGRIFTDNPRIPIDGVIEFDLADDVASYFGAGSPEALRAAFYFGFVSKSITSPPKLSFSRWASEAAPARIYGERIVASLADFNAVVAGNLNMTVGDQAATLVNVDLSAAASLAAVAAALQTAIRAEAGSQFANALVTYDPVTGSFNFEATTDGVADISVVDGALAALLGWQTGAVLSPGVDSQTPSEALATSVEISNNFGSFAFIETLTVDEVTEAAAWNAARNVEFMYAARATAANAAAMSAATLALQGTGVTLAPDDAEFDEILPMAILAATNYDRRNAVQNYMFQQAALTPKVTTNAGADLYDNLRVNYYGNTQTAGQQINFYQRGVLMGGSTAPVDMNTYANEIWLKDAAQSALISLLLALPRIPANVEGRGMVISILQSVIDAALFNGTISIGKALTTQQKLYVTQVTGDETAWYQVQAQGYWLDAVITSYVTTDGRTEYKVVYTLVYSKDDAIRKIEGSDILI